MNPGYRYQYTSLAGKRLRPLGHRSLSYQGLFGWRGIRTPGGLHLNGFQDRLLRPLGHPSICFMQYMKRKALCQAEQKGKKGGTNHPNLPGNPLTVATFLSWRGWAAVSSSESVPYLAERGGFEPPMAFDHTRLPIVHLRPLGHLSKCRQTITKKLFALQVFSTEAKNQSLRAFKRLVKELSRSTV